MILLASFVRYLIHAIFRRKKDEEHIFMAEIDALYLMGIPIVFRTIKSYCSCGKCFAETLP